MKKGNIIILFFSLIIVGISFSCKKNWTCQCESKDNSNLSVDHHAIDNETKKDAKTKCKEYKTDELDCALR